MIDSFTMRAVCWTPEDRNTVNDLALHCSFAGIQLSVTRIDKYATITFRGYGQEYNRLKKYVEEKHGEQSKI